jgi:hypothetical protein
MSDKLNRVLRTALGGFVSGVLIALGNAQVNWETVNLDAVKVLAAGAITAGVTAAVSAVHNYLLDPSPIPSLAPAPVIPLPEDKDTGADGNDELANPANPKAEARAPAASAPPRP